ncbi:MAG: UDP-3-O-(3-hydroxymyristoyl)glucosamine N-acyltransferase [Xanthobacteraceae bacterium]|nr:UDP-3-O-(3-hydroxymyristoyl)glucosamine N-acyltransferase [Xanthobacteraceae bacterium]MCW5677259.1 UDP-3-O-(3-hydroxymyristoyl)glucosamine N-acyltransferase [Xanthobacteraceae bacterium]
MTDPIFFRSRGPLALAAIGELTGAAVPEASAGAVVSSAKPLDIAGPEDLTFYEDPAYAAALSSSDAGACFVTAKLADSVPAHIVRLIVDKPYAAFVKAARALFPDDLRPLSIVGTRGVDPEASVHEEARLEDGVVVDPGAVIGPDAEIGAGTIVCANVVIGSNVRIGRDCSIGPGASITHALIGDRVIIHAGVRIGQDGFGYIPGKSHLKVPQLGRVVIQDDVEIGAGTTVDRGGGRDTMIGEGTKIDNLVQVAHNVSIGRHCIIAGHVGLSGSVTLGDGVMLGGKVGIADHRTIGDRAQLIALSGVMHDVPAGERWGGAPAKPLREFFREQVALQRLAGKGGKDAGGKSS